MPEEKKRYRKQLLGEVVSDKMDKTVVVKVIRHRLHPVYQKYIRISKRIKAHDENNEAHVGDKVRVLESRPYSKEKCWKVLEIVEKSR